MGNDNTAPAAGASPADVTKDTPVPKAADASIDTKAAATTTPPEDKMVQVDDTGAPGKLTTLVLRVVSSACARSNRAATLMTSNVSCAAVGYSVRPLASAARARLNCRQQSPTPCIAVANQQRRESKATAMRLIPDGAPHPHHAPITRACLATVYTWRCTSLAYSRVHQG